MWSSLLCKFDFLFYFPSLERASKTNGQESYVWIKLKLCQPSSRAGWGPWTGLMAGTFHHRRKDLTRTFYSSLTWTPNLLYRTVCQQVSQVNYWWVRKHSLPVTLAAHHIFYVTWPKGKTCFTNRKLVGQRFTWLRCRQLLKLSTWNMVQLQEVTHSGLCVQHTCSACTGYCY